jgi:hypothetical protein
MKTSRISLTGKRSIRALLLAAAACVPFANAATISWNATYFNDVGLSPTDYAKFQASVNTALSFYSTNFQSPNAVTVNVEFHAGNTGLGTTASYNNSILYQDYRNALATTGTSAIDAIALSSLPNTASNPVSSSTTISTSLPLLRALGFSEGNLAVPWDASVTLNTTLMTLDRSGPMIPGSYDLLQVTYHELNEVLGFTSALNGVSNSPVTVPTGDIQTGDLFRYQASGVRSFTSDPNEAAYFSIDNGTTVLANFNTTDGGDRQDFNSLPNPSVQDAYSTPDIQLDNGIPELTALDVIGYNAVPEPASASLLAIAGLVALGRRNRQRLA